MYSTGEAKSGIHTTEIENENLSLPIDLVLSNLFVLLSEYYFSAH